jgi:hypothetical protein
MLGEGYQSAGSMHRDIGELVEVEVSRLAHQDRQLMFPKGRELYGPGVSPSEQAQTLAKVA